VNVQRHTTYMNQVNRRERSFEEIKAEQGKYDDNSADLIEVESGVFVSTSSVKDLINPTDEELYRLAGGALDMKNLGKKGIDLRSVLAQRALHIKRKLYDQAVAKGLAAPKQYNFYRREIRPLLIDIYHDSDSEDEEVMEKRSKEAKAVLRAQRRTERKERKKIKQKIQSDGDDVGII
jgi:hypothetical protein